MKRPGSIALALTALAFAAGASRAQTTPPTAGAGKPKAAASLSVTVTNHRKATVSELDLAPAGSPAFKPLLRKLGAGKSTVVVLPRDDNCTFDLYAKYDDGETTSMSGLDLCVDGKINLVE